MGQKLVQLAEDKASTGVSMWPEALFGIEVLLLRAAPVYYGLGTKRGDGSPVVVIPGFLGVDLYLTEMFAWLRRIGYRPYFSGIGLNAECPNLLIRRKLTATLDRRKEGNRQKDTSDWTQSGRHHCKVGRE